MGWGGRWEGGSGWGTHVNPCLIHVNVWQKTLQYYKVISLQLIKIIGKKRKTIGLAIQTFVGRVTSLHFNTVSRFVMLFLSRSRHVLISFLQSLCAMILEPKKIKSATVKKKKTDDNGS